MFSYSLTQTLTHSFNSSFSHIHPPVHPPIIIPTHPLTHQVTYSHSITINYIPAQSLAHPPTNPHLRNKSDQYPPLYPSLYSPVTLLNASVLTVALHMKRFDLARYFFTKHKLHPIFCGSRDYPPLFVEYIEYGTFNFIPWLVVDG